MVFLFQPHHCNCCKAWVWHCEDCWNKHHNGLKHKDFIPSKYPNQPIFEGIDKMLEKFKEEFGEL